MTISSAKTVLLQSRHQLSEFNVMFPFEYKVSRENLIEDDRFILSNMGGELTVALK